MNIPGGFLAELPFELSVNEDSVGDVEIVDVGGDGFKLLYRGKKRSFSLSTLDFNEKTIPKRIPILLSRSNWKAASASTSAPAWA